MLYRSVHVIINSICMIRIFLVLTVSPGISFHICLQREREKCMYIQDLVTPMKLEYDSVSYWSKKAKFLLNLSQKQKDKYYQEKNCNVHPV